MEVRRFSLLCVVLLLSYGGAHAEDWPQFLGPTRDAVYQGNDLAATWPKEGPRMLWHKQTGQGFSGPVVSQGKLILFHRIDKNEVVQCFDAESGKSLWEFAYPSAFRDGIHVDDGPRSTPCIAEGKVYTFGADGALHCLDLNTGAKVWNVDTRKTFGTAKNWHGMICSPLVEGNGILLNIGSTNAGLVAFNKETGDVLWKKTKHRYSCSSPVAATIGDKRYAFFFTRRTLCAVDPANGHLYFEYTVGTTNKDLVLCANPVVIGDLLFVSAAYQLGGHLLRVADGKKEVVWTSQDIATQYTTSIHHDGFLYGVHGQREMGGYDFRCVDLKSGKLQWKRDDFGQGTILKAGNEILFLTYNGELIRGVPSPKEFTVTGRAQVAPFGCRAYPALANGRLYVRSQNRLLCVDLSKSKA